MKNEKEVIAELLQQDATLLALLGANKPFYNPDGTAATINSIFPIGQVTGQTVVPFVTIQVGEETRLGTKLYDLFIYIRAYDNRRATYVKIQEILERIKVLVDGTNFTFNSRLVQCRHDHTVAETVDDALGLNFQESRYRLLLL